MKNKLSKLPHTEERPSLLAAIRNQKMASSAHAYVRGNTLQFYEWLDTLKIHTLPEGPPIWICGDCHLGNLGPLADAQGHIDIQIRDLDQTVIGNPAHDLIRLGLSMATAARGSDLSGMITAKMMEALMEGYGQAFNPDHSSLHLEKPISVQVGLKQAQKRTWKHLARERIEDTTPTLPMGRRFWPLSKDEKLAIKDLFETQEVAGLATSLRSRDNNAPVDVVDAAYWMKGCSSLGRLRYAVLLAIGGSVSKKSELCLIDMKEAVAAAAPSYSGVQMPRDNGERIVEGARHLAPNLGERMLATRFLCHSIVLRELLPQDLKLEIDKLTQDEAIMAARYLATVVGKAHACQMDIATRKRWQKELRRNRTKTLDAPSWLWNSIVELVTSHERAYLEHCRKYAQQSTRT